MQWLFKSRTTPGVYTAASGGAWQQIAKALPDRTTQQVSYCKDAFSAGQVKCLSLQYVFLLVGTSDVNNWTVLQRAFMRLLIVPTLVIGCYAGVGVRDPHPAPLQLQGGLMCCCICALALVASATISSVLAMCVLTSCSECALMATAPFAEITPP